MDILPKFLRVNPESPEAEPMLDEITAIINEVLDLSKAHGHNRLFVGHTCNFMDFWLSILWLRGSLPMSPACIWERDEVIPRALLVGLGRYAAEGLSIPSAWAFSYLYHARRCRDRHRRGPRPRL